MFPFSQYCIHNLVRFFFASLLASSLSACSFLLPDRTAPKSAAYSVTPPKTPWIAVPVGENPDSIEALRADLAYENPQSGSIISLNSLCRKYNKLSLDDLTRNLVLGIPQKKTLKERFFNLDGARAKDTLFSGMFNGVEVNIRTIVLKKRSCTYDFLYVSTQANIEQVEPIFNTFISSFHAE